MLIAQKMSSNWSDSNPDPNPSPNHNPNYLILNCYLEASVPRIYLFGKDLIISTRRIRVKKVRLRR